MFAREVLKITTTPPARSPKIVGLWITCQQIAAWLEHAVNRPLIVVSATLGDADLSCSKFRIKLTLCSHHRHSMMIHVGRSVTSRELLAVARTRFLPPPDAHRVQCLHTNLATGANFQIVSDTYDDVCKVCACTLVFWPFDRRIGPRHSVDQDSLNVGAGFCA